MAYDEFQNVFSIEMPRAADLFGADVPTSDRVLRICYRNPREILVCAHALGLGVYGDGTIVQMLENRDHWEDVGYRVVEGDLEAGERVKIERLADTTPLTVQDLGDIGDIVQGRSFTSVKAEILAVVESILTDLKEGLRPDDVLVVTVDDRYARAYLSRIEERLARADVRCQSPPKANVLPLRYDFDPSAYREGVHPASHLHVGDSTEVRICTQRRFTAMTFTLLVIRQMYPSKWASLIADDELAGTYIRHVREGIELVSAEFRNPKDAWEHQLF